MKKQLIAKLLVLGMVLSMLPVMALADSVTVDSGSVKVKDDGTYYVVDDTGNEIVVQWHQGGTYTYEDDTTPGDDTTSGDFLPPIVVDPNPGSGNDSTFTETPVDSESTESESTESEPVEAEPVVVETVDDVKTETNEDGQTVVTATIAVEDSTAPVAVSAEAVETLVSQAKEGDIVAIVAETTGAVSAPAEQLAKLIETTGNSVSLGNSVAAVAVNAALVELAEGAEVKVEPVVNEDGTISVPVTAGDKEIAPEDVPGGIDVEVPVDYTADEVSGVNGVKADKTEVELEWSISVGKLQVNLTVTCSIKIIKK